METVTHSFGSVTVNIKNIYTFPLCLYTLSSWSSCENCTIIEDYNENCKLCNPYKFHRGYAVQIKACNSCLKDVFASDTRDFLCSDCHYGKCDQWENPYPGLIARSPKCDVSLYLRDWYPNGS